MPQYFNVKQPMRFCLFILLFYTLFFFVHNVNSLATLFPYGLGNGDQVFNYFLIIFF